MNAREESVANMLLIIALLSFVFIFLGLAGLKIRGRYVGPLGWLLTRRALTYFGKLVSWSFWT
jgi:hypothetical protein